MSKYQASLISFISYGYIKKRGCNVGPDDRSESTIAATERLLCVNIIRRSAGSRSRRRYVLYIGLISSNEPISFECDYVL